MNTFWKIVLWVVGIAIVAGGAYALAVKQKSASVASDKIFTIGGLLPLTGDFGSLGEEVNKGALLAIEEAKDDFPELNYVVEDDAFAAASAVSAAQKLIATDKINAGFTMAVQEAKPIAPVFNEAGIPLLVAWDSNAFLKTGGDSLYSIGFSTEGAGVIMAEYAYQKLGLRKVAVVRHVDEWADIISASFRDRFKQLGGVVVLDESTVVGTSDYRTLIARIKAVGADSIYFPMVPPGNSIFAIQARELQFKGTLMNGDGFLQSEIDAAGKAAEGLYFTNVYGEQLPALAAKYKAKYGVESGDIIFASFGYDAVNTLVEAYRISKESGIPFAEALKQVDIPGIGARIRMNGTRYSERQEKVYKVTNGTAVEVN
jgi:branched-chain amino acid transport system substrate-binding protein